MAMITDLRDSELPAEGAPAPSAPAPAPRTPRKNFISGLDKLIILTALIDLVLAGTFLYYYLTAIRLN